MRKPRFIKGLLRTVLAFFVLMNVIAAFHAYKFTHFSDSNGVRTERIHLSFANKLKILFTGVDNPRPVNTMLPAHPYKSVMVNSNVPTACWIIPTTAPVAKGTVLLFHGFTSNKSALLDRADPFLQNGYNCLLVDFMGSGGSGGNETTIGFKEAQEVNDCYNYIHNTGEQRIYLYGSSMGAAAIMKAMKDYPLQPKGIIIECPFGTMYETVCARFRMLHVPSFPMAGILLFWGGVENSFWGFSHNPEEYAKYIKCPTLLQYGAMDDRVTRKEIDAIYANIPGPKQLVVYALAGHDNYLLTSGKEWEQNVLSFINSNK